MASMAFPPFSSARLSPRRAAAVRARPKCRRFVLIPRSILSLFFWEASDGRQYPSSFAEPAEVREHCPIFSGKAVTGDRAAAAQNLVNRPLAQLRMQDVCQLVVFQEVVAA